MKNAPTLRHGRLPLAPMAVCAWLGVAGVARDGRAQVRVVDRPVSATQPTIILAVIADASTRTTMHTMRGSLRRLLTAQETFWRGRHAYASDVSYLSMFHPDPGVVVQITRAEADGWAARATSGDAAATWSCAIWVGDVPPAERPATAAEHKVYPEAEVSCDGDGYTARGEWAAAGRSYMTHALHTLRQSEARYYALHRRYSTDPAALDPFVWDRDVSVTVTTATVDGWSARATFAGAPGTSCVLRHGTASGIPQGAPSAAEHVTAAADAPDGTATAEQVICDGEER